MKLKVLILLFAPVAIFFLIFRNLPSSSISPLSSLTPGSSLSSPKPKEITLPKVTLDNIFSSNEADLKNLDQLKIVKIVATGDVIPARTTNYQMVTLGNFKYPFEKTFDFLKSADLTVIDLESSLTQGCKVTREGMQFCGDPRFTEGLEFAGVDIASLENNHIGNYGKEGINQTKRFLEQEGIDWVDKDNILYKEIKSTKFSFLAFNGVGGNFNRVLMTNKIKEARKNSQVVIVSLHWGKEYTYDPEPSPGIANDDPKEIAKEAIDSGADLIIGNHPHWVQGIQIYADKFISYAHGNFIFDQMWSTETRQGVIGIYTFYEDKLIDVEFKPIIIDNYAQPHFVEGEDAVKILTPMKESSLKLKI
ncbi:MAG: hypothetical protein A2Y57_03200 [Candidatus Woykebacteria bacterium RBG_13_40_7b]|uniref:Capsule synthesis protein CapA domain-containing protein n=1 Tax=Candidatus Woykebacteria bacterium RBG_13_40_7b TaxID=1802594 RepID=A0A1G1W5Z9_9BACT|nr:MAG: hypothetical protein A2Y57_03200 [Candidatus Woykebacteria bacterium RBG_13_40_7b]